MDVFFSKVFKNVVDSLLRVLSAFYNRSYKSCDTIDSTVVFCPEKPGIITIINPEQVHIGEFSVLNRSTHINPGNSSVRIGRFCHLGQGLTIYAFNHNFRSKANIPYDNTCVGKSVEIHDFVWCGANVTILPGVSIGEGAIIGAGAVVSHNIPDYAIAVGNPIEIKGYRDIELFRRLKSEKKFF